MDNMDAMDDMDGMDAMDREKPGAAVFDRRIGRSIPYFLAFSSSTGEPATATNSAARSV